MREWKRKSVRLSWFSNTYRYFHATLRERERVRYWEPELERAQERERERNLEVVSEPEEERDTQEEEEESVWEGERRKWEHTFHWQRVTTTWCVCQRVNSGGGKGAARTRNKKTLFTYVEKKRLIWKLLWHSSKQTIVALSLSLSLAPLLLPPRPHVRQCVRNTSPIEVVVVVFLFSLLPLPLLPFGDPKLNN